MPPDGRRRRPRQRGGDDCPPESRTGRDTTLQHFGNLIPICSGLAIRHFGGGRRRYPDSKPASASTASRPLGRPAPSNSGTKHLGQIVLLWMRGFRRLLPVMNELVRKFLLETAVRGRAGISRCSSNTVREARHAPIKTLAPRPSGKMTHLKPRRPLLHDEPRCPSARRWRPSADRGTGCPWPSR